MKSTLSPDQLVKLKFIESTGYYFDYKEKIVVHNVSEDSASRIVSLLSGRDTIDAIKPGSKVYILPNPNIFIDLTSYKEGLKQNGYKITGSIENADFVVGSSNLKNYRTSKNINILDGRLEFYTPSGDEFDDTFESEILGLTEWSKDDLAYEKYYFNENFILNRSTKIYHKTKSVSAHLISDNLMKIVYSILAKKIPVINDETLFESFEKLVIDNDIYESLIQMARSSSRSDQKMAHDIIATCDFKKSSFFIWNLSNKERIYLNFNNTKLSKRLSSFWYGLQYNSIDTVDTLIKDGLLDKENYEKFIPEMISTIYKSIPNFMDVNISFKDYSELSKKEVVND